MEVFEQQVKSAMEIVKAATLEKRLILGASRSKFEKRIEAITSALVAHGFIAFIVLLALAALTYFYRSTPLFNTTLMIGNLVALIGISIQLCVIASMCPSIWEIKKNPYGHFFKLVDVASSNNYVYIQRLKRYEARVLQFVLMNFKNERNAFEHRSNLVAGALEKIGFFPALGALATFSISLYKSPEMQGWANMLIFLLFAFNVMAFASSVMRQRQNEVISVLEYVLNDKADERLDGLP